MLAAALYFGMQPATQVDSAFHPFEVDKLRSTTVMGCVLPCTGGAIW